jgi:hypothetical protein
MHKLVRALSLILVTSFALPALAARQEVAIPGLSGGRMVWDTTTKKLYIEIENRDVFEASRFFAGNQGFNLVFNEGAGKGLTIVQTDGTAMTTTTAEFNVISYGNYKILHSPTTSGGTTTPIGITGYLDIGDGNATDDDVDEYFMGGVLGVASGKPFTVGTDPAFYTCATINMADGADAEEFLVGFQAPGSTAVTAVPQNATLGSHINYALIGQYDTAATCTTACPFYVLTGIAGTDVATDTTEVSVDATDYKLCVFVSSAGVVTYTKNGSAPTATAAATMADGVQLVPYIKLKQNGTDDSNQLVAQWEAGYTETD